MKKLMPRIGPKMQTTQAPNKKLLLIKCGGSIINNTTELNILLQDISALKSLGYQIILVHGGGPDINQLVHHSLERRC